MNDTVDKQVIFLAKRDGIDKLVKTFQYVSKIVHWHLETTNPDTTRRAKQWEVASSAIKPSEVAGFSLASIPSGETQVRPQLSASFPFSPTPERWCISSLITSWGLEAQRKLSLEPEMEKIAETKENIRKIFADRVMRLMAMAANIADLVIAGGHRTEPSL
ncbi:hypothetical protein HHK36_000964 [Tetracentron sinense]|uniref:Uncharacterized protein n=1 Tax=Tetracentron sinense TaxID=13715 RepID=A0A834ZV43_TETSI|nr:hypothetical protein HHK36_000964 [Tetracentron sinense]